MAEPSADLVQLGQGGAQQAEQFIGVPDKHPMGGSVLDPPQGECGAMSAGGSGDMSLKGDIVGTGQGRADRHQPFVVGTDGFQLGTIIRPMLTAGPASDDFLPELVKVGKAGIGICEGGACLRQTVTGNFESSFGHSNRSGFTLEHGHSPTGMGGGVNDANSSR